MIEVETPIRTKPLPDEFPGLHYMDEEETQAVLRVMQKKHLYRYYGVEPPGEVASFEMEFAAFLGVRHAVGVTSGSAALHTALSALGVGPGQEVIVPAYLWVSVVAAIVNLGAIPVLADIDDTFCLNAASVEKKITPRTAGVIVVHMNGAPADVQSLLDIKRKHGIFLLEDCAQCVGGSIDGRPVGSFGDIATFSFQINKNMTSGEGGCVATNDPALYRRCIACHDTGYVRAENGHPGSDFGLTIWGRGYRLDEIRGTILRIQLRKLPGLIEHMRASKYRVRRSLEGDPRVRLRSVRDPAGDTGGFLITTYRDEQTSRSICGTLRSLGIATASPETSNLVMADYGLHIYSNIRGLVECASNDARGTPWTLAENRHSHPQYARGTCPVADDLFARSVVLVISSCLTAQDENDIIAGFQSALEIHSANLREDSLVAFRSIA